METPTTHWKLACANIAGHRVITQQDSSPLVAFSPLALPPAARGYLAQLSALEFTTEKQRERGAKLSYFEIAGWHLDPAQSLEAKAQTAEALALRLPERAGRSELISYLGDTFAELASAWDRNRLLIDLRGNYHARKDVAHTDYGTEYTSIANLTNLSTLFAPPETYRGIRPRIYSPEGTDGNLRCEYRMSDTMKKALEGLPLETIASWRGTDRPAVHLTPDFKGTRIITLVSTYKSYGYGQALR